MNAMHADDRNVEWAACHSCGRELPTRAMRWFRRIGDGEQNRVPIGLLSAHHTAGSVPVCIGCAAQLKAGSGRIQA